MPWHKKAMKDVVSCDKPRGDANNHRSEDFRIGKPTRSHVREFLAEYIGRAKGTEKTETSKYLQEQKTNVIPRVAASERGLA